MRVTVLPGPWWIAVTAEVSQFQVANCQSYDGRLVQLAGDGRRQRQHFGQLVELVVLFAASWPGCISGLFLSQLQDTVIGHGGRGALLLIKSSDD